MATLRCNEIPIADNRKTTRDVTTRRKGDQNEMNLFFLFADFIRARTLEVNFRFSL